jgi:hypothetical protein
MGRRKNKTRKFDMPCGFWQRLHMGKRIAEVVDIAKSPKTESQKSKNE